MNHDRGRQRSVYAPPSARLAERVVQMRRTFRTNNQTFVVDTTASRPVGFKAMFEVFAEEISNYATANAALGPGKKFDPTDEQSRWLYFAFRFLLANQALIGMTVTSAARKLLDVVCAGGIRARAVDPANELNFGREVLRIIGYRRTYLSAGLPTPSKPNELKPFFERDDKPRDDSLDLDEKLLRRDLETDLVALMKKHDPGQFKSVRLHRDPLTTAKAVHRFARNFFRRNNWICSPTLTTTRAANATARCWNRFCGRS